MSVLRHPDWHLFAEQKFRRRNAVRNTPQTFRGEPFVVLSDQITGQHVRLSAQAQDLWRRLDGRLSAQQIWEDMMRRPATAPTQAELVDWLLQLVQQGLILSDHELDPSFLTYRSDRKRSGQIEQKVASPLSIKIKLFDPDPLVRATWPLVCYLFTPIGGVAILALYLTALIQAVLHAGALLENADSALLSQAGLMGLAVAYPIMKALHELAHCYALYRFGGRVREFGVMLLVLFPVPYVEASDASVLPDKRARMLVGAAGILAEMVIASLALLLWLALEPGIERALLFNFILLGTVSTLLFNGNPLLKFDAYFVLADWLEMPNLARRAGEFLSDRFLWRICGLRREIEVGPGEAPVLAIYGTLSLLYRVLLTLTIALIVSNWFFFLGILLAVWAVVMGLVWPLIKTARKGARMAKSQSRSGMALVRILLVFGALWAVATLIPLPFAATGEGQVIPVADARLGVSTTGRLRETLVAEGTQLRTGDPVAVLEAPEIEARLNSLDITVTFLSDALARAGLSPVDRQRIERELSVAQSLRADVAERVAGLTIRAPRDGPLVWHNGTAPSPGAFFTRGDTLGHVLGPGALELAMALPAAYSGLARGQDTALQLDILLPDGNDISRPLIREQVVDVGGRVPPELLVSAGGPIPEQPSSPGRALTTVWLGWADPGAGLERHAGMRFDVRVRFGSASLLEQSMFHLRRLFLRVVRV